MAESDADLGRGRGDRAAQATRRGGSRRRCGDDSHASAAPPHAGGSVGGDDLADLGAARIRDPGAA